MTTKADFNAEEWDRIAEGPALAGLILISAQRGGMIRETFAMAKVYAETNKEHGDSDFIGELAGTKPNPDMKQFSSKEDLRTRGLGKITEAVELLETKADPDEVEAYRSFALSAAQRAAEADKSGGFLGIGGERVTDAERTALTDVAAALGTDPPADSEPEDPAAAS
jgi:hypothetical protein